LGLLTWLMWNCLTWSAPRVVLVPAVMHHSLRTGAVFQRSWSVGEVGSSENMLNSPRQSTRRPILGLRAVAAATYFGTIALTITCCLGNAVSTACVSRTAWSTEISEPRFALWNSPQAP
jgi:hypothetical protein